MKLSQSNIKEKLQIYQQKNYKSTNKETTNLPTEKQQKNYKSYNNSILQNLT